jgi:hypothetical protein
MKKISFILLAFLILFIALILNFSFTSKVISDFSEVSFVSVSRVLPENYEKNVPFEVILEIDFNESILMDGNLFFGEVVEGGEIIFVSEGDASFRGDVLFWNNLNLEDKNISYSVISNSDVINFSGKWGLNSSQSVYCLNCEGKIRGDISLSVSGETVLDEVEIIKKPSGGSGSPSGNGGVSLSENLGDDELVDSENVSFADVVNNSNLNNSFNFESQENSSIWALLIVFFISLILIVGIIIYFKFRNSNSSSLNVV